jgi:hypothetical protein
MYIQYCTSGILNTRLRNLIILSSQCNVLLGGRLVGVGVRGWGRGVRVRNGGGLGQSGGGGGDGLAGGIGKGRVISILSQ